jgi:hypothetical protein
VSAPRDCSTSQGFSAWMQRKVQRGGRMLPLSIPRRKRLNAGPADLPIEEQTRLKLVLNQKAAQQLGLTFPLSLSAAADAVVE